VASLKVSFCEERPGAGGGEKRAARSLKIFKRRRRVYRTPGKIDSRRPGMVFLLRSKNLRKAPCWVRGSGASEAEGVCKVRREKESKIQARNISNCTPWGLANSGKKIIKSMVSTNQKKASRQHKKILRSFRYDHAGGPKT